jgi:hypothetical protein
VGLCGLVARNREGFGSVIAGAFQRLGVTPDGSGVVFEVSNEFALIGETPLAATPPAGASGRGTRTRSRSRFPARSRTRGRSADAPRPTIAALPLHPLGW